MVPLLNYTRLPECERNSLTVFACTAAVYVLGTLLITLTTFVKCNWGRSHSDDDSLREFINSKQIRWFPKQAEALLAGKTIAGKLLILVRSVLYCICSFIYLYNTYSSDRKLCIPVDPRPQYIIELGSNLIFLFIFILKVVSSKNLLHTWLSLDTVIDHCTILPNLLAVVFGYYQYSFGFLYFTRVLKVTEFLLLLKVVDEERSIRKLKIISNLLAAWFTSAGAILLLERLGNFWQWKTTQQNLDYFDCVYFLLVTVATVGYGDIVCTSYLGRLVTIVIIIGALISVTTHVSELYDLFFVRKRYRGTFNNEYHPRHVIVCGAISHRSVSSFLDAFVRVDCGRFDKNVMTVFLSAQEPDVRLKALLKREVVHATYLKGDATLPKDLKRAKTQQAEAVIILTDPANQDHSREDWDNIMRVVSVKNLYPTCRMLCMLNVMENKSLMSYIPGWREEWTEKSDRAICTTQFKLGLLALNCLVRGISSLLTNLLVRTALPTGLNEPGKFPIWMRNYFRGTQYSMYTVKLSSAFDGMFFHHVARTAMRDLRLIVVAVQVTFSDGIGEQVIINPGNRLRISSQTMRAIVLAENFMSAQLLRAYRTCSTDTELHHSPEQPHSWSNRDNVTVGGLDSDRVKPKVSNIWSSNFLQWLLRFSLSNLASPLLSDDIPNSCLTLGATQEDRQEIRSDEGTTYCHDSGLVDVVHLTRDSTNLFYWVTDRPFDTILLTFEDISNLTFRDHILVCITKRERDVKVGLANFVMPLRSTRIPKNELKSIVFLCDEQLVKSEWYCLKNFPNIYMLSGSPLSRVYLRAAGVQSCSTCVVISCSGEKPEKLSFLSDKESILCTLIIRSLLAESIEKVDDGSCVNQPTVITALSNTESVSLLSITKEYKTKNELVRLSPHYMAGTMFASPVLNNLASNVFFDPTVLTFLETVLLGCPSYEVEKVFAVDSGFSPGLRRQLGSTFLFPGFEGKLESMSPPSTEPLSQLWTEERPQTTTNDFSNPKINHDSGSPVPYCITDHAGRLIRLSTLEVNCDLIENPGETVFPKAHDHCVNCDDSTSGNTETVLKRRWDDREEASTDHSLEDKLSDFPRQRGDENKVHSRNWPPLETNSYLSDTRYQGFSVKGALSRLQLLPLTSLGRVLNELLQQTDAYVTFGLMFDVVLTETGTICIGLYRRLADDLDDSSVDVPFETVPGDGGIPIKRYVFTFPHIDTRIVPNDLVYCFTAISEEL